MRGRAAARSSEDEPLFRARLIGIGFDPERRLVLIELREHAADEDDEDPPPPPEEARAAIARLYATRAQIRAMMRNGVAAVEGGRPKLPAVRLPDGSRRAHLPAAGTDERVAMALARGSGRSELLRDGEVDVLGRMPWSSNATFLVNLADGDDELLAIYKPQRGERPLWDFPRGTLCHREVAAYEVSEALGWDIVPDTVLRDGPAGIGMMQRFVDHDPEEHYFTLLEEHADDVPPHGRVRRRDQQHRSQGRSLPARARDGGRIFGIDHGVSFHAQWKLRTVIWDFGGEPIPPDVCADLHRLADQLRSGDVGEQLDRRRSTASSSTRSAPAPSTCSRPASSPRPTTTTTAYPWPMI